MNFATLDTPQSLVDYKNIDPQLFAQNIDLHGAENASVQNENNAAYNKILNDGTLDPETKQQRLAAVQNNFNTIVSQFGGNYGAAKGALEDYYQKENSDPYWAVDKGMYDKYTNLQAEAQKMAELGDNVLYEDEQGNPVQRPHTKFGVYGANGQLQNPSDVNIRAVKQLDPTKDVQDFAEKIKGNTSIQEYLGTGDWNDFIRKVKNGTNAPQVDSVINNAMSTFSGMPSVQQYLRHNGVEATKNMIKNVLVSSITHDNETTYSANEIAKEKMILAEKEHHDAIIYKSKKGSDKIKYYNNAISNGLDGTEVHVDTPRKDNSYEFQNHVLNGIDSDYKTPDNKSLVTVNNGQLIYPDGSTLDAPLTSSEAKQKAADYMNNAKQALQNIAGKGATMSTLLGKTTVVDSNGNKIDLSVLPNSDDVLKNLATADVMNKLSTQKKSSFKDNDDMEANFNKLHPELKELPSFDKINYMSQLDYLGDNKKLGFLTIGGTEGGRILKASESFLSGAKLRNKSDETLVDKDDYKKVIKTGARFNSDGDVQIGEDYYIKNKDLPQDIQSKAKAFKALNNLLSYKNHSKPNAVESVGSLTINEDASDKNANHLVNYGDAKMKLQPYYNAETGTFEPGVMVANRAIFDTMESLNVKIKNRTATQQDVSKYNQIVQLSTVSISHFVSEMNQDVSTQMAGPSDVYSETSNK